VPPADQGSKSAIIVSVILLEVSLERALSESGILVVWRV